VSVAKTNEYPGYCCLVSTAGSRDEVALEPDNEAELELEDRRDEWILDPGVEWAFLLFMVPLLPLLPLPLLPLPLPLPVPYP